MGRGDLHSLGPSHCWHKSGRLWAERLSYLTFLSTLDLSINALTGSIPTDACRSVPRLESLDLGSNQLTGSIPGSIGNCSHLLVLDLGDNRFSGEIPSELGNCSSLSQIDLSNNQLSGVIPSQLGFLYNLQFLDLEGNRLTGSIPPTLANCTGLRDLHLGSNRLGGFIPKLEHLEWLHLSHNQLSGNVPWDCLLANSTALYHLQMSHNLLQGFIPDFTNLTLVELDLSFNRLNGTLPPEMQIRDQSIVASLSLSHNALSGGLPPWLIGGLPQLSYLDLSHNNLVGQIPTQFVTPGLLSLDLSNNKLTGMLPPTLGSLTSLDVSFNNLEGPIPTYGVFQYLNASSFQGNPRLCGLLIHKPCSHSHSHEIVSHSHELGRKRCILIAFASLGVTIALIVIFRYKCRRSRSHHEAANLDENFKGPLEIRKFSTTELMESTHDYSERNLLGEGALSIVYKGVLPTGEVVAIKRFKDVSTCSREVLVHEAHIMNKIRHRNLVRVLGYVLNREVHALVLQHMPNGSLEQYLRECRNSYSLSMQMILKIVGGVANALTYLHHEYDVMSIIHGDVKPSNILLDSQFEAHLADFGLAKLANGNMGEMSVSSNIKGSIGYMAPEFAYAAKITTKVDIYSFGVVVLEMVTGMGPTHELLHGVTLHEWVKHKLSLQRGGLHLREIVHASIMSGSNFTEVDEARVRLLLWMAVSCTNVLPDKRPTMYNIKKFLDSQVVLG